MTQNQANIIIKQTVQIVRKVRYLSGRGYLTKNHERAYYEYQFRQMGYTDTYQLRLFVNLQIKIREMNRQTTFDVKIPDFILYTGSQEAKMLFESYKVYFQRAHVSGVKDNATGYDNIKDASEGQEVQRSNYGNAPGGTIDLNPKLLAGLLELSEKYKFTISELAGGSHSKGSEHYKGNAVDIPKIDGERVNSKSNWDGFAEDARKLGFKVLGPGDPNHSTHLHLQIKR